MDTHGDLTTSCYSPIFALDDILERRRTIPIREYSCKECEEEFEELVFSDDEEIECPKCKGKNVARKMSAFAIKSGGKFVPASGTSCSGCSPGPGGCSSCGH